jgi:heme exporter protein A
VLWCGSDVRRDLRSYHGALAYVGHEPSLKADLTAYENLHYWIGVRRRVPPSGIRAALEKVGGHEWHGRMVRTLSAGQKRRTALAALLLLNAPLWLLDEPTTNLDAEGQGLVEQMIEQHAGRGGLVVAAVHHGLRIADSALRRLVLEMR